LRITYNYRNYIFEITIFGEIFNIVAKFWKDLIFWGKFFGAATLDIIFLIFNIVAKFWKDLIFWGKFFGAATLDIINQCGQMQQR